MIAALATLFFLTTLWMLVVAGAALFEKSGGKIRAALARQAIAAPFAARAVRLRYSSARLERPRSIMPRMRAAA